MPIHEYRCIKCEKTYEIFLQHSDKEPTKCEDKDCNGKLERIMSKNTFKLKGKGWAEDNYCK